jgi:hypothetical protein
LAKDTSVADAGQVLTGKRHFCCRRRTSTYWQKTLRLPTPDKYLLAKDTSVADAGQVEGVALAVETGRFSLLLLRALQHVTGRRRHRGGAGRWWGRRGRRGRPGLRPCWGATARICPREQVVQIIYIVHTFYCSKVFVSGECCANKALNKSNPIQSKLTANFTAKKTRHGDHKKVKRNNKLSLLRLTT